MRASTTSCDASGLCITTGVSAFGLLVVLVGGSERHPNPKQLRRPYSLLFSRSAPARTRRGALACPAMTGALRACCARCSAQCSVQRWPPRRRRSDALSSEYAAMLVLQRGRAARKLERASADKDTSKATSMSGRASPLWRRPVGTRRARRMGAPSASAARLRSLSNAGEALPV